MRNGNPERRCFVSLLAACAVATTAHGQTPHLKVAQPGGFPGWPVMTGIERVTNGVRVTWDGPSGYYQLQQKSNLTGAAWLPGGWGAVQLLLFLALAKVVAASLTIGSEGSAGDFAPSLAIGGLLGGAFGRGVQLLVDDPRIDPGAFALVGMGAFYGGIAHAPLSALVLVCELAGNYDLLVPLMLAQGITFVALRKRALYEAQVPTQRDSPAHQEKTRAEALMAVRVRDLMLTERSFITFDLKTPAREMLRRMSDSTWQDVFPVVDGGRMVGLVNADAMRVLAAERTDTPWVLATDVMSPALSVRPDSPLPHAAEYLIVNGLREVPVVDEQGNVVGFLDERDVAKAYLEAEAAPMSQGSP